MHLLGGQDGTAAECRNKGEAHVDPNQERALPSILLGYLMVRLGGVATREYSGKIQDIRQKLARLRHFEIT